MNGKMLHLWKWKNALVGAFFVKFSKAIMKRVRELWIPVDERPTFADAMALNRFQDICRTLRFDYRAIRIARLRNN